MKIRCLLLFILTLLVMRADGALPYDTNNTSAALVDENNVFAWPTDPLIESITASNYSTAGNQWAIQIGGGPLGNRPITITNLITGAQVLVSTNSQMTIQDQFGTVVTLGINGSAGTNALLQISQTNGNFLQYSNGSLNLSSNLTIGGVANFTTIIAGGYLTLTAWQIGSNNIITNAILLYSNQVVQGADSFTNQNGMWNGKILSPSIAGIWGNTTNGDNFNGAFNAPLITNGVNYSNAFSSPGSGGVGSAEQFGAGAIASGFNSTAIGASSGASSTGSTVIGNQSSSSGLYSFAAGFSTGASGDHSIAIGGRSANATSESAIAIGNTAFGNQTNAVSIGEASTASGFNSIALGPTATASASNAIAIGVGSSSTGTNNLALGVGTQSTGTNSVAIGQFASSTGTNSFAMGNNASASFPNSAAIGNNSASTAPLQLMLGAAGQVVQSFQDFLSGGNMTATSNLTVNGSATFNKGANFASGQETNILPYGYVNFQNNSDVAFSRYAITSLANGVNADIQVGTNVFIEVSGPSAAFTLNGFASGRDGKIIYILNQTGFNMAIANESGSDSTAANRIRTLTGFDIQLYGNCVAKFVYDSSVSRWIYHGASQPNHPTSRVPASIGGYTQVSGNFVNNNPVTIECYVVLRWASGAVQLNANGGSLGPTSLTVSNWPVLINLTPGDFLSIGGATTLSADVYTNAAAWQ